LRSAGRDLIADSLEEKIQEAIVALRVVGASATKATTSEMKKDIRYVTSLGHSARTPTWIQYILATAMESMRSENWVVFGDTLNCWPKPDMVMAQHALSDRPSVAGAFAVSVRKTATESESLAECMKECFYSDGLSKLFKDPSTQGALQHAQATMDALDLTSATDAALDLPDCFADIADDIIASCQAIIVAGSPIPSPQFYESAKTHFAPEQKATLKIYQAQMVSSMRQSPLWRPLIDCIWSQAEVDREAAPDYFQLEKDLCSANTSAEEYDAALRKCLVLIPRWRQSPSSLREGALRKFDVVILEYVMDASSKLLAVELPPPDLATHITTCHLLLDLIEILPTDKSASLQNNIVKQLKESRKAVTSSECEANLQ
jgi:hypothetical protein